MTHDHELPLSWGGEGGVGLILRCLELMGLILECFGVYRAHPQMSWVLYGVNPETSSRCVSHPGMSWRV